MDKYFIFKDGREIAETSDHEEALEIVKLHQSRETHFMLRAEFSIIKGEKEFVKYPKGAKR